MSAPVDVAIEDVWKQYRLGRRRDAETFWALQQVDLEVPRGSTLGVIGRNGAGKSTLLKLLAGITAPSRGRIVIHGRVAALIEVGSGFHPELTGRDNVFLSGAILGMTRREIGAKLERIVEFAGVRDFIDTPVKRYSSGMYVRLGFAVAAHLEPDILLIDEVLAVGDAEFQVKCLQRIQELKDRGTTNIFISHDLTAVERLCDSAVLLERGVVAARGRASDVVGAYHRRLALWDPGSGQTSLESPRSGVALTNLALRAPETPGAVAFQTGKPLAVSVRYQVTRPLSNVEFELRYYSADGRTRLATFSTGASRALELRPPGGTVEFTCPALPFTPGTYFVGAIVRDTAASRVLAWWDGETRLYVHEGPSVEGLMHVPHTWSLHEASTEVDRVSVATAAAPVRERPTS
jgi:ABC-type polysaccharide/polyol phosphate transport system ATPase subunit